MIAFKGGGALDTVIPGKTGLFFKEQTVESLVHALQAFDAAQYDPAVMRAHALQFDSEGFRRSITGFVEDAYRAR